MSENQGIYDIVNRLNQDKVYEYNGRLLSDVPFNISFKYKFKITGDLTLLHMGNPLNHIGIDLTILELTPPSFQDIFKGLNTRMKIDDRIYYLSGKLKNDIWRVLQHFSLDDSPEIVNVNLELNSDEPTSITESQSEKRNVVRKVVEDIIQIFKSKGDGEYTLPEDTTGEFTYQFENLKNDFNVELRIQESDEVDKFELDGGYYEDDETIEIEIVFNPEAFPKSLYELVGDLNETFRHELQHHLQYGRGDENPKGKKSPEKYYSQPHELDAQVAGIKRKSKITKQPFEQSVRDWFAKNKNKHTLNNASQERVIQRILQYYNNSK
jgi:hypothetical protein